MAYLNKIGLFVGLGVLILALGSDGAVTIPPNNTAVLNGTSRVIMSCASDDGYLAVQWNYVPVGGSPVLIATGSNVASSQNQYYAIEASGSGSKQSNLIILSATTARAGTYSCTEANQVFAQLIIINSDPVCSVTPNTTTELLYNQTVQMSCSITYTANNYVTVDMIWSKGNPSIVVNSAPPQTTTSANLTTAVSTITQTPGYATPFPIYRCNTTFKITGNPSGSANNAPDYSNSSQLFSSPINVIYLKPAEVSSITGATDGAQVLQGTTVTCRVDGNPPPTYSWLDVTNGNRRNTSTIQIGHSGQYQCTAWNKVTTTSVSINVTTFITTSGPAKKAGEDDATTPPSAGRRVQYVALELFLPIFGVFFKRIEL